MAIIPWIVFHRPLFALTLGVCSIVNNTLHARHVCAGKCRQDDFGYFWRLWRAGERDGRIVMGLSMLALVMAGLLMIAPLG